MPALAEGSTGGPVKKLQTNLNTVMSSGLKTSGVFDDKTKAAVIKFQKKAGLKANGTADANTVKSLTAHVVGLTWPHGDPAMDQKSVKSAVADIKSGSSDAKKKFDKAETESRSVADLLKANIASLEAAAAITIAKWNDMAKFCGEQAALKKDFEKAKKAHDLGKQKDLLAKAKTVQDKIELANTKGYSAFEDMGSAARDSIDAIKRLTKLDGDAKKVKCGA